MGATGKDLSAPRTGSLAWKISAIAGLLALFVASVLGQQNVRYGQMGRDNEKIPYTQQEKTISLLIIFISLF